MSDSAEYETDDDRLIRKVISFAVEVQAQIDAIFARNPECVEVWPWIGRDGELTFIEVTAVDVGL